MASFIVTVEENTHKRMLKHTEIDWNDLIAQTIKRRLDQVETTPDVQKEPLAAPEEALSEKEDTSEHDRMSDV